MGAVYGRPCREGARGSGVSTKPAEGRGALGLLAGARKVAAAPAAAAGEGAGGHPAAHSELRCGSVSSGPAWSLAAAAFSTPRSHSVHLRTRPSSTAGASSSYSTSSYLCRSLSSDTGSAGRGSGACRLPGGGGRRPGPAGRAQEQGPSRRLASAEGEGTGRQGRASSCFSRWRLCSSRTASGVRLSEKRTAASGPEAPAGLGPQRAGRAGARGGAGPGARRAGGLFRVVEGQEPDSSPSGRSGGRLFSPAAAGGEGAGGVQVGAAALRGAPGLRFGARAAGTPGVGAGARGGMGGKGMVPPSRRVIGALERDGRLSAVRGGPGHPYGWPGSAPRAPAAPTCVQPRHPRLAHVSAPPPRVRKPKLPFFLASGPGLPVSSGTPRPDRRARTAVSRPTPASAGTAWLRPSGTRPQKEEPSARRVSRPTVACDRLLRATGHGAGTAQGGSGRGLCPPPASGTGFHLREAGRGPGRAGCVLSPRRSPRRLEGKSLTTAQCL